MPDFMAGAAGRIVGGQPADSPIPWQVYLSVENMYSCGGTILDASTILSAAHCFPKSDSPSTIRAGSLNRWSGGQVLIYFFFIKISLFFRNKRKSYIPLLITILLKCKKIMIFSSG